MENKESNTNLKQTNRVFLLQAGIRLAFLGLAFIGTVWLIAAINSGSLLQNPNSPTSILLGIPAQKSH